MRARPRSSRRTERSTSGTCGTGRRTVGTKLTYFEANNAYWVPFLNSFVNFQAEGARGDHLEQWTLTPNGTFVPVFRGQWYTGGFVANGVNGLFLNLTAHLLWAGVDYQGGIQTFAYNWSANGTLDAERYFYESPANVSKYPNPRIVPQVSSDEHRFTVVGSGPAFQTAWWPYGGNESFAVDPTPGHIVFYSSNVSVDHLDNSSYYPTQAYAHWYSLDGQYFDTSRLISYYSYDCLDNFVHVTTCPVAGTSPGTVAGTVYYVWKTGLPEAANPTTNGQAQVGPPPEPVVRTTEGVDWVNVSWTDSETPLLNLTLSWGSSPGSWPFSTSLTSSNRSFNVTGLHPATFYEFRVVALNLHSADAGTIVNLTLKSDPDVPTDLRTVGVNATNASVAWTNPPDSLVNTTVYVGLTCGTWTQRNSAGVVAGYRIRGLAPQTRYCVEVGAWNVTGESPRSDALSVLTAGVPMAATNLVAIPLNDATIALSWSNPPGSLVNVTVFDGLECGAWTHGQSVGVVAEYLATGLLPDTTYCFSIQAWNASGAGPLSAPIRATPLRAPPDAPTELEVAAVSAYGENLTWVLPTGLRDTDLLNTSLYEGASCGNWSSVTDLGQVADAWQVTGLSSEVQYRLGRRVVEFGRRKYPLGVRFGGHGRSVRARPPGNILQRHPELRLADVGVALMGVRDTGGWPLRRECQLLLGPRRDDLRDTGTCHPRARQPRRDHQPHPAHVVPVSPSRLSSRMGRPSQAALSWRPPPPPRRSRSRTHPLRAGSRRSWSLPESLALGWLYQRSS